MMKVMINISYVRVVIFLVASTAGREIFHVAFLGGGGDEALGEMGRLVLSNNSQPFNQRTHITIDSPISCTQTTNDSNLYKQTVIFENDCSGPIPNEVGISETGIRLTVADDALNLHVLQTYGDGVNPVDQEGYLAISDADLGMEYYTSTYCSTGGICQFAVTPIDDNTRLQITFPDTVTSDANCMVRKSGKKEIPFLLDEFQVLHFESEADLSGIHIKASKNIAVFVGARNVPDKNGNNRTRLIEQIPPVNKWGKIFIVVPNIDNEAGDLIKIVTRTDNTEVTISGFSTFIIPLAGGSVERRVDKQFYSRVKANKPILIVQIMGINLYNQSTDALSQPSMVLLQHTGQWIKGTTYVPCETPTNNSSLIFVATNDINFAKTLIGYSKVPGECLYGGYKQLDHSVSDVNSDSAYYGAIGVCHGKASFILKANWPEEADECAPTTPFPGDDQDNNCNGQTDEHHCTENDRDYTFISGYYDTHESTIGHIRIAGATTIPFSVQLSTCNSIAYIHLRTDDEPTRHLSIQVASDKVSILYSNWFKSHSDEIFGSSCTERHQFNLNIHHDTPTGSTIHELTFGTIHLNISTNGQKNLYTEMLLMSNEQNTSFTVDLMGKDCGKIYSGEPDSFGRHFLAPLVVDDFTIYTTANTNGADVKVTLGNNTKSINVNAGETISVSKSDFQSDDYGRRIKLHSDNEISVYVTQFSSDGKVTGFKLIPVDVLGPRYHVYVDNSAVSFCTRFSFSGKNTMDSHHLLTYQAGDRKQPILAQQPIAVFCGSMKMTLTQMPPIETLGTDFYIPPLPDSDEFSIMIKITTTEDSTNVSIEGDYLQLHTFDLKSTVFTREYVCLNFTDNSVWKINATKPIQVVLEIQDSSDRNTWGSIVVIPPVNQYKNATVFENVTISGNNRFGVDNQGTIIDNDQLPDGRVTFSKPTFVLTFINMLSNEPPHILVVPSDVYYKDENQICTLGNGEPGDGVDNDCDGLVDEKNCTVTDISDSDIDGSLYEDCSNGTRGPIRNVQIHIPSEIVHCISSFAFNSTRPVTYTLDVNEAVPSTNLEPTLSFDTFKAGPGPPRISFPSSFSSASSNKSTNASSEPEAYCEYMCPCAWVMPETNYTEKELLEKVKAIQKRLTIDKDSLSATIRKKKSASDKRTQSLAIGYSGMLFLIAILGIMVVLDVTAILRDARVGVERMRAYFNPE